MSPVVVDELWLARYAHVTRNAVLGYWQRQGSCIASVNVGLRVARYFGVPAHPQPVAVAYRSATHSLGTYATGVVDRTRGRWDGHLVAIIDDRWLVDLSADQFDRPGRGLRVTRPVITGWEPATGDGSFHDPEHEVTATFRRVHDTSFKRAPDWTWYPALVGAAAGMAIRALKTAAPYMRTGVTR